MTMIGSGRTCILALSFLFSLTSISRAESQEIVASTDWTPNGEMENRIPLWAARLRDGVLAFPEDGLDLSLAVVSDATRTLGTGLMAVSDLIGVVDDNPLTQYVTRGIASRTFAQLAFVFHSAGTYTLAVSHGNASRWMNRFEWERGKAAPNPLGYLMDGMFHKAVYTAHIPGSTTATAVAADLVLRPIGNVLYIAGSEETGGSLMGTGFIVLRASGVEP